MIDRKKNVLDTYKTKKTNKQKVRTEILKFLSFDEEVEPFIYDYETADVNENYDYSKYHVDASVSYSFNINAENLHSSMGVKGFENEKELIDFYKRVYNLEEEYIKKNSKCIRTVYYKCYKLEDYQTFNNFNIENNIITISFNKPENKYNVKENRKEYYEEEKAPYAINIVTKEGEIITDIIYEQSSPWGYNAEKWQYDYEKKELDFVYPSKTIFQIINIFITRYVEIFIIIFLILAMISLKVFVSRLIKLNATKKIIISHIFLQPLYQIMAWIIESFCVSEIDRSILTYFIIILVYNIIFSIIEILLYIKIIKNETRKKIIIYTLVTNIIPLFFVYVESVSLMYGW